MRKGGIICISVGIIAFLGTILFEVFPLTNFQERVDALVPTILFTSLILISGGIGLVYFQAEPDCRKRVVRRMTIVTVILVLFGIISMILNAPGASLAFGVGLLLFAFAALPLVIKTRYETRKNLIKGKTQLLNFADFITFTLIILGILFRVLHWPGANYFLIAGMVGLVVSFSSWNSSFRGEVKLRAVAEEQLKKAFAQLEEQHEHITQKNREILDSIHYAERIQKTILPGEKFLKESLQDYFVYYHPRDIVSGDFYWGVKRDKQTYFAVADSTGHGVPGAFMSLLNSSFLNEAIVEKRISATGEILNFVRERLIDALSEDGSEEGGKDGMDCVLLKLDAERRALEFSAANNSVIVIRNNELLELEGNRMPVGRSFKMDTFDTKRFELLPGDVIYAFTDGYADQFGGPQGKKFMRKNLTKALLEIHALPMDEQRLRLQQRFTEWQGKLEQLDDVLITGIRV
jgi:serine phosphatase RsbU (regulator of sigma subunit)